ncbi:MAG: DNA polymerase III subunit delta' [Pseudomonadota bacterium]|jgi:DNA polymerase-3 subunit delta'|nr:DNA polymerase III subunit delta' [Syntrophaceae bacterium]MBP7033654.1 DNA polymerase III subunit delta' [Syntrophobacterales bacterium]MDI9555425.1 DNA polymerase III subunit delta' [Pseudomonadota bacterium]NLX30879.1 DNA polymerase III subunit delta' [Deltaproteobacteria bacterium]HNU84248.1 DNA polymerase III subunit delta' [Syntrophales bacterium]
MSFANLYGQDGPIDVLKRAVEKRRVPHAFLFYGAEGVGKRTAALALAKALNCERGGGDACDACASCRKIDKGNHPDLVVIEPEGQFIKVADIKELQERMRFRPLEGTRRVVIINDAERMNATSANSLLKTLEEPSAVNVFLLVSSRPHLLPMTILSRCHRLRFNPVPRDVIAAFLEREHGLAPERARILASSSGGSIGRAISLHRGDYIARRDGLLDRVARGSLDPMACLDLAGRLAGEKEDILEALDILKSWYRDLLVFRETGDAGALIHRDRAGDILRLAPAMSGESILAAFREIRGAAEAIERNANKPLTLETMVFTLFADKANFVEDSRRGPRAAGPGR